MTQHPLHHHCRCPLSLSTAFSVYPPLTSLLLFAVHIHYRTRDAWISGSPDQSQWSPWTALKANRSVNLAQKTQRILFWEGEALLFWKRISYSLWTFANSGEDRNTFTLWGQDYDDSESNHLRNVELQIQVLLWLSELRMRLEAL